jgi:hypothetical protein
MFCEAGITAMKSLRCDAPFDFQDESDKWLDQFQRDWKNIKTADLCVAGGTPATALVIGSPDGSNSDGGKGWSFKKRPTIIGK